MTSSHVCNEKMCSNFVISVTGTKVMDFLWLDQNTSRSLFSTGYFKK